MATAATEARRGCPCCSCRHRRDLCCSGDGSRGAYTGSWYDGAAAGPRRARPRAAGEAVAFDPIFF